MNAQEIIETRVRFEAAIWEIFGETLGCMPDMRAARVAYNERCRPLYDALPPPVVKSLKDWQKPISDG